MDILQYLDNPYYLINFIFIIKYNISNELKTNIFKYIKSSKSIQHPVIPLLLEKIKKHTKFISINSIEQTPEKLGLYNENAYRILHYIKSYKMVSENNIYCTRYKFIDDLYIETTKCQEWSNELGKSITVHYKETGYSYIHEVEVYYDKIPKLKFGKIFYEFEHLYDRRYYSQMNEPFNSDYIDTFTLWNLGIHSKRELNSIMCCNDSRAAITDSLNSNLLDNYIKNNYILHTKYLKLFKKEIQKRGAKVFCDICDSEDIGVYPEYKYYEPRFKIIGEIEIKPNKIIKLN